MKKVRLNKEGYSCSSKRSVGFDYLGEYYEDKRYQCKKCYKSTVYTAEEQKEAFEVKKRYMWQQRFLCGCCYNEMCSIRRELQEMEQHYCENREQIISDEKFLRKWLKLLVEYTKYCKKGNPSRVIFIKKTLGIA